MNREIKLKPCSSCGITGIHACLGSPSVGIKVMCGVLSPKAINSIKRDLDFIDKKAKENPELVESEK